MRPRLLQSFFLVVVFWFILTTLWWSFQKPEVNLAALRELKDLFPFLPFEVPATASILGSLGVQKNVLLYWTFPMLVGTAVSALLGYGMAWWFARDKAKAREHREKGKGNFRGVTLSVGELPVPKGYPRDEITLSADDDESLARLTAGELTLLGDILGTISAHPNAYAGAGIPLALLDHTLEVVEGALKRPRFPGLTAIVAAAHEMGKILAFEKNSLGEWQERMPLDKGAVTILRTLDSWHKLPNPERLAVLTAVEFHSKPKLLPEPEGNGEAYRLAKDLLFSTEDTRKSVEQAVREQALEAARVDETLPLSDQIFDVFLQSLATLAFQNRGLPKAVPAVAWKTGSRVYLLEIRLREQLMAKLPDNIRGLLQPDPRNRARIQPFTVELLKALAQKGWLVAEVNGEAVSPTEALWKIQAGKLEFKGVIIIDVPAEHLPQLPAQDSMYDVQVTGPLYTSATPVISRASPMLGEILTPPPAAAAPRD